MWRKQVRAPASSHTNLELLALDKPTRPLLSSDWSESDSSIQPLSAGRWRVTRERCGEIGMWRKQVRASASSHTNLEPLVIILFYLFLLYFIIF